MSHESPGINLNSPLIQAAAKRCGLSVPDFVEYSVLTIIHYLRQSKGELEKAGGADPAKQLELLRGAMELTERIRKLPPFEREKYEQDPDYNYLNLNSLEEE